MKSIFTSVLLIICVGVFGQKVVSRSVPLKTCDSPRIFKTDTLWYNEKYGISVDTSIWYRVPQKDTVDVIVLVSDTVGINNTHCYDSDGTPVMCSKVWAIKCKAVREIPSDFLFSTVQSFGITEYLLPKKYIVWQSIIINKTK